jgi:hypothetical protein
MSTSEKKPSATDARERKRARFEEQAASSSKSNRGLVAVAIIAVVALAIGAYFAVNRNAGDGATSAPTAKGPATQPAAPGAAPAGGSSAANAPTLTPEGDAIRIPAASVTPTAAFYKVSAGSTVVPFFAVRDAVGQTVVALDACNVCAHAKKGYEQKGDQMICKNCGLPFAVKDLARMGAEGGCHPITLPTRAVGDSIVVDQKALAAGAKYF